MIRGGIQIGWIFPQQGNSAQEMGAMNRREYPTDLYQPFVR